MIASYNNPEIIIPNDAVGVDAAIGNVQKLLGSKVTWIQKIFGRSYTQYEQAKQSLDKSSKQKERIFPQVYSKTGEPLNVLPNDNLDSYCFFNVLDPGDFLDYEATDSQHFITRKVCIIFWYDINKIAPGSKKPINEELILSVVKALQNHMEFEFERVYETFKKVFEPFTIDENFRQYMRFPYSAFRIDGTLSFPLYAENCDETPIPPEPIVPNPPFNGIVSSDPNEFTFTPAEVA